MIKVVSNIIPFKGFVAMCLWPFLFVRRDNLKAFTWVVKSHEKIHAYQQVEMLFTGCFLSIILALLGFQFWSLLGVFLYYWWYLIEWLIKYAYYRNAMTAYKNVSFEREAYKNQGLITYLDTRDFFGWFKYIQSV